jgi:hypothetical protein
MLLLSLVSKLTSAKRTLSPLTIIASKISTRNQPADPLTKISESEYVEGYWASKNSNLGKDDVESSYPWPKSELAPDTEFISKIKKLMLELEYVNYRGLSICRLCEKYVGNKEYYLFDGKVKYRNKRKIN